MGPTRLLCTLLLVVLTCSPFAFSFQSDAGRQGPEDAAATLARPGGARAVPHVVRFTGALRSGEGIAQTGTVSLTFSLYGEAQGGAPLWLETQNVTLDEQGRYTVLLGTTSTEGLPMAMFAKGAVRWLGVRPAEEGAVEQPRVQLVSVPYALAAGDAQSLGGRPMTDFALTRAAAVASGDAAQALETSGTVTSTTNTLNRVAKFTATDTLGDSLIFDNGTNVGIGTATPASVLHLDRVGAGNYLRFSGGGVFRGLIGISGGGGDLTSGDVANDLVIRSQQNIIFANGNVEAMRFTSGNVGIGITGPASILHLDRVGAGNYLRFSGGGVFRGLIGISGGGGDLASGDVANDLVIRSQQNIIFANSNVEAMRFSSGNVGIGTTSPSQRLEVGGTIYSTSGGFKFPDGTTQTTAATGGGAGTITGVTAGTGLTGGGTTGTVSLAVNPTVVQSRVIGTCAAGQYVRVIGQDGSVTCGVDATTSGTGGGAVTFSGSTSSGIVTATQSNAILLQNDPTFAQAQTTIPGGIVGISSATSNTAAGVAGFASSINAIAVLGWNGSTTGSNDSGTGVLGLSDNPLGHAIEGNANAITGNNIGVSGTSSSTSGMGVRGKAEAGSGNTIGVQGEVTSATGTAGNFVAPSGTTSFLLRGNNNGPDVFKVDGNGTVFAAAYKDLAGNPIGGGGSGGTVTSITAGTGLSGGTITTTGTLSVDSNAVQSRVTGSCSSGSAIRTIASNGSVTCEVGAAGMSVYDAAGNTLSSQHIVRGSVLITSGTATVTLTGSAAFTGQSGYNCTANYTVFGSNPPGNTPVPIGVYQLSGTSFVVRGPDNLLSTQVNYICIGN